MVFSGYMLSSGISGLYGIFIFIILSNCKTVLHLYDSSLIYFLCLLPIHKELSSHANIPLYILCIFPCFLSEKLIFNIMNLYASVIFDSALDITFESFVTSKLNE